MKFLIFTPSLLLMSVFIAFIPNVELSNWGKPLGFAELDGLKLPFLSQPALAQNLSSNPVLVYGTPRCGWTSKLIQELKMRKISYQFKNLDIQSIRDEWNQILSKNGVPDGSPVKLPVVLVNAKVFMRPSLEQVIAQRKKAQNSTPQTPQIPNGRYIGESPSDAIIEIKNNQYCGANFQTDTIECFPVSDLKYIKPGVVQLGKEKDGYFCSEKLFKISSSGECTAGGWIKR